jgi:hypothetical protein
MSLKLEVKYLGLRLPWMDHWKNHAPVTSDGNKLWIRMYAKCYKMGEDRGETQNYLIENIDQEERT